MGQIRKYNKENEVRWCDKKKMIEKGVVDYWIVL